MDLMNLKSDTNINKFDLNELNGVTKHIPIEQIASFDEINHTLLDEEQKDKFVSKNRKINLSKPYNV